MNHKLTLRMDEALIANAKVYAATHGSSVSQLVANYFAALTTESTASESPAKAQADSNDWEKNLGPFTRSLLGVARPSHGELPTEDDYYAYLEAKHSRHLRKPHEDLS